MTPLLTALIGGTIITAIILYVTRNQPAKPRVQWWTCCVKDCGKYWSDDGQCTVEKPADFDGVSVGNCQCWDCERQFRLKHNIPLFAHKQNHFPAAR